MALFAIASKAMCLREQQEACCLSEGWRGGRGEEGEVCTA